MTMTTTTIKRSRETLIRKRVSNFSPPLLLLLHRKRAEDILNKARNGVDGIDKKNLFNPDGLSGLQRRFVALNGALGAKQLVRVEFMPLLETP